MSAEQGRAGEAIEAFRETVRRAPNWFEAHCRLALALRQGQRHGEAAEVVLTALQSWPKEAQLHLLLGAIRKQQGEFAGAAECCRKAIALVPANPHAHYNLGLVLQTMGRLEEALGAYRQTLDLHPDYVDALVNLAVIRQDQQDLDAAIAACERAVRLQPMHALAHWQLATALLARGDWVRGWREYEWRWRLVDFATPPASFPQPLWDGSDLHGRRILLHAEQGFGDMFQFIRYAPLVALRGGQVVVGCPAPAASLLARMPSVWRVITSRAGAPPFEVHLPILSLPRVFNTTLETIPREVPYLSPPERRFPLPEPKPGRRRVGLVWGGDPKHRNDHNRSAPLAALAPLGETAGVDWFSLQTGPRASELNQPPWAGRLVNLGTQFIDFDQTASVIAQLDLVISVDTSVAHLAGALGKPVWTLLPFAAEWRWLTGRQDSPWYPGMRLFRQPRPGAWGALAAWVRAELQALIGPTGTSPA